MKKEKDFFWNVYELVKKIPPGRVSTYGLIGQALGSKSSARIVGWALNSAHKNKIFIPAHRVVNAKGLLSGKHNFETPSQMQLLLEREGIQIQDNKIINFDQILWYPFLEIKDFFI